MAQPAKTDIILIRHAPTLISTIAGRTDVQAHLPAPATLDPARRRLATLVTMPARVISSPARRCLQTAAALCPAAQVFQEARLWEQNYGDFEGKELADVPDLGRLSREEIAAYRPPNGESFLDLAARAGAALAEIVAAGPALIFAHGGTIRAGIGLALGDAPLAMAFEVAHLSATLLRRTPDGQWSIGFVNVQLSST